MKNRSKLLCILLAMILVIAMSVPAFADGGTNTITVTGAQKGETYSIYKMLDLSVNSDKSAYSYTVNSDWNNFFTGEGAGVAYVNIDSQNYVTWKADKDTTNEMEKFAKAAASYASSKTLSSVVTDITPTVNEDITFNGLESGYYLITSTNGTLAMVQTTPKDPNATIEEKNPDSTIEKLVYEDSTQSWREENSAQIGDTVNFKSTVTVKKGAKDYVVHDKMDDGLTFSGADSIKIYVGDEKNGTLLTKETSYTVAVDTDKTDSDCTFEIKFKQTYLDTITTDTVLTVTYDAVLNENAKTTKVENNKTMLTWGKNSSTEWVSTNTKTYEFKVLKYDGGKYTEDSVVTTDLLAGAQFKLKYANGNAISLIKIDDNTYRVANTGESNTVDHFVTVKNGAITIYGLDLDDYELEEIVAPDGFKLLNKNVDVKVDNTKAVTIKVGNNSGTELPSTGGMGTTVFYVVGAALVLGAVVLLITRKRMGTK